MAKDTTTGRKYRGYTINNGQDGNLHCHTKTLDQIIDTVELMAAKHSKVFSVRLDIQNTATGRIGNNGQEIDYALDSKDMTRIIESATRTLNSKSKEGKNDPDVHWVWTTERTSPNDKPHFHVNAFVNGNAIQNGYSVKEAVSRAVKNKLQNANNMPNESYEGLVNFSSSNGAKGKLIERNSPEAEDQINDVVFAGSYLAKVRTKEFNPKGSRVSSCTRIKKS